MYKFHKDNLPNPKGTQWDKDNRVWYQERNKQLVLDRKEHTLKELTEMYGICQWRVQKLIEKTSNKFKGK